MTDLRSSDPVAIGGYRVLGRLGSGGQGVVYLASTDSGERVAIKQLRHGLENERARQQFAKEVAAARRVSPFCTAQLVDVQLDGPMPYVVSEFIEGPSLEQQIRHNGPMTGVVLQRMAIGTVTALAAIHQAGVVHRDFKPANVMLAPDGPRVIDFGIARNLLAETTTTSSVSGTPAFMSPEQLQAERVGPATDMFAWASVIAYAATGRAPFEAENMMAIGYRILSGQPDLSGVPADLLPVLRQCLDKDPARRPTAQQALAMLLGRPAPAYDAQDATQVLAEATVLAHGGFRATKPRRRRRRALTAIVLVLLLGGAGGYGLQHSGLFGRWKADLTATGHGTPKTGATGTANPPATVSPSVPADGVPPQFVGTWTGTGRQLTANPGPRWTARITIAAGLTDGEMNLTSLGCTGPLIYSASTGGRLTMDETVDHDPRGRCAAHGTFVFTPVGANQLTFTWEQFDNPGNRASGSLIRAGG